MKIIIVLSIIAVLTGCTGQLYTVLNPSEIKEYKENENDKEIIIKGVVAYPQINVIETYITTALVDKDENIINQKRVPKTSYKFAKRVDYDNPYILRYEHGILESYKFGVGYENGVVTNINTESAPYDGIANIKDILPFYKETKDAALEFDKQKKDLVKFCNAQPVIQGVYKHVEIKEASDRP